MALVMIIITNECKMIELIQNGNIKLDSFTGIVEGIAIYVFHLINLSITIVCFLSFAHIQILVASLGLVAIIYINIQFKQNQAKLYFNHNTKSNIFQWILLKQYWTNNLKTFEFLFICNQFCRNIFLAFIIVVSDDI